MNKKILFGLAAAAAVVLAVITYSTNPPATEGTEATIGAAQRAQAPQIAAKDVALGDQSAQDVLQTELWDQLAKDEDLRNLLTDANVRHQLTDEELRHALGNLATLRALKGLQLNKSLEDPAVVKQLGNAAAAKKFVDVDLQQVASNQAVVKALENDQFRAKIFRAGMLDAMMRPSFQTLLKIKNVDAALRGDEFANHMARNARKTQ